ncbi:MAG TPA: SPASM domain-containing protein [Bdellovibrionota bacterium]|nr:SPASM domain-containing protein [Bdellovibrionota bacterium]
MAIEIEINHDCNRTCAYCPNATLQRKNQGQMSEELFLRLLTELREIGYGGRISYHFYNEPLLSPQLDRFVGLTRRYLPECRIEIYTNGTLLTEDRLMTLLTLGVDKFLVTKHHGLATFPFEELYEKLQPAIRSKIQLQGYKEMHLTSRGGLVNVRPPERKPPLDLPCLVPSTLLVVTVNGNVLPCFEDFNELNVMGNLNERSLLEIWNSERYRDFRVDLKRKRRSAHAVCKDCNHAMLLV